MIAAPGMPRMEEVIRSLAENSDNTGTIITASGTVLAGVAVVLVTYFVRRTSTVAQSARRNFEDQQYTLRLVATMRDDYWNLSGWGYYIRERFTLLRTRWNAAHPTDLEPASDPMPIPAHREMEAKHAQGVPLDEEGDE